MATIRNLFIFTFIALTGCATHNVSTTEGFAGIADQNIMLMAPDVKYYRVTASGINEPNADWTNQARTNFDSAIAAHASNNNLSMKRPNAAEQSDLLIEYDKLHAAVGSAVLEHHYGLRKLPAKAGAFDWSLGSNVSNLNISSNDQYALFTHYRDYQASGGRIALAIFAAALNTAIYTGHQGGFASLVNLETGDVVWFNNVAAAAGDLRTPAGAKKIVDQLLAELTVQPE